MTVDYSLVITWTYFSLYFVTFVIVSILCAMKVRQEYKESKSQQEISQNQKQMSKKKAIIYWAKLSWKKKKVYLQLIPHFFDQATDFGVIYEYWRLSNDGNDYGINVYWLLINSIAFIIIHKTVSCVAIYRLTKDIKYTILQLFDLLMVQCIWQNYLLDTDEPSNAQRYLQVLEAIFEVK